MNSIQRPSAVSRLLRAPKEQPAALGYYLAVCKPLAPAEASAGWRFLDATTHLARETTLSVGLNAGPRPAKLDIQSFDRRLRDVASLHC